MIGCFDKCELLWAFRPRIKMHLKEFSVKTILCVYVRVGLKGRGGAGKLLIKFENLSHTW